MSSGMSPSPQVQSEAAPQAGILGWNGQPFPATAERLHMPDGTVPPSVRVVVASPA